MVEEFETGGKPNGAVDAWKGSPKHVERESWTHGKEALDHGKHRSVKHRSGKPKCAKERESIGAERELRNPRHVERDA